MKRHRRGNTAAPPAAGGDGTDAARRRQRAAARAARRRASDLGATGTYVRVPGGLVSTTGILSKSFLYADATCSHHFGACGWNRGLPDARRVFSGWPVRYSEGDRESSSLCRLFVWFGCYLWALSPCAVAPAACICGLRAHVQIPASAPVCVMHFPTPWGSMMAVDCTVGGWGRGFSG